MRVRFGDSVFDSERRELLRAGSPVAVSPKAFALMEKLILAHPAAVSKEDLYDALWPGVFVEIGNLHTLIAELRSALGDDRHEIIRTIHRFGYALGPQPVAGDPIAAYLIVGDREVPLRHGENIVGRDLIGAPDVSRRHARITVDDTVLIEDLDSKNGTFVQGERVTSARLGDGDEFLLGRTRVIVRLEKTERTITVD